MMRRFLYAIIYSVVGIASGQSLLPLNGGYPDGYLFGLYNPAGLTLSDNLQAAAGMQFMYSGLSEDALRNHYISISKPLADRLSVGLRTTYFTSDIYQNMEMALQAGYSLMDHKLAVGMSANMIRHGYNKDKFTLFDMNDPVINGGTSSTVFSAGGGLYLQPINGLHIGFAADHLNEPDISLNSSGLGQKRIYYAGISCTTWPLAPQADLRMESEEWIGQIGANLQLFDHRLRIYGGYNHYSSQGNNVLAEGELLFGNMGLVYGFQYPLTNDINNIATGSHQIGLVVKGGGGGTIPIINLENLSSRLQIPQAWLKGKVANQDGLQGIEIRINDRIWKTWSASVLKKARTFDLSETIPLDLGRNIVQVTAFGNGTSALDKVFTLFEPDPPRINIITARNVQIKESSYALHFIVSDPNEISRVRIYHDGDQVQQIDRFPNAKSADISLPITLMEGKNRLIIQAENAWLSSQDSLWIEYRPREVPPTLAIHSTNLPISGSSQIVLKLDLENAENIKEVVIKVNGMAVDTARVRRTKIFGIADVAGYDSTIVVNLSSQSRNLIEAIAVDDQGLPRISQALNAYYNPFAEEMRYRRKRAFIIGINNYKQENVPDLVDAIPDARSMAAVLDSVYHFDQVQLLLNERADYETLNALFSDTLAQASAGEFVLIYFSGHGDKFASADSDPLGFLLPWDAALETFSKRITMDFINGYMRSTRAADVLCIFDACFSGAAIVTRPEKSLDQLTTEVDYNILKTASGKKATNLITAASRHEPAVDGLFTRILVRGLRGAADRNDDGYITSTELALYTQKLVGDEARNRYHREQNAQFGGLNAEYGECVFERR